MVDRISASDVGYTSGMLSIFPDAIDNKNILYEVKNNASTKLKQSLSYNGKIIIVDDATGFPSNGILRVGSVNTSEYELIYYDKRTNNTFQNLKRGFAGSKQNFWFPDNKTYVTNSVTSDTHNAIKDAILNIERNLGLKENPTDDSLNGILKMQEVRFLSPKPLFRAFPIKGVPELKVRFQNFTTGHVVRYLWDFGDGGTSLDKNPIHTYVKDGIYTVKLNIITSTGAQGIVTKSNYIEVNSDESLPFFYVESLSNPYSSKTALELNVLPKEFVFIDQTDGDIIQRNWIFGDGSQVTIDDPDIHIVSHIFSNPGEYIVTLLIIFNNGRLKKVELPEPLIVL